MPSLAELALERRRRMSQPEGPSGGGGIAPSLSEAAAGPTASGVAEGPPGVPPELQESPTPTPQAEAAQPPSPAAEAQRQAADRMPQKPAVEPKAPPPEIGYSTSPAASQAMAEAGAKQRKAQDIGQIVRAGKNIIGAAVGGAVGGAASSGAGAGGVGGAGGAVAPGTAAGASSAGGQLGALASLRAGMSRGWAGGGGAGLGAMGRVGSLAFNQPSTTGAAGAPTSSLGELAQSPPTASGGAVGGGGGGGIGGMVKGLVGPFPHEKALGALQGLLEQKKQAQAAGLMGEGMQPFGRVNYFTGGM